MLHHINKRLEARCGLSTVQWFLLKTLLNMPTVSQQVLAQALGVTPGTLSQTLARLERKKYLFMCADPTDARKKMISITRQGRNALDEIDKKYKIIFSEIDRVNNSISRINEYLKIGVQGRLSLTRP